MTRSSEMVPDATDTEKHLMIQRSYSDDQKADRDWCLIDRFMFRKNRHNWQRHKKQQKKHRTNLQM